MALGAAQVPEDPTLGWTSESQAQFFYLQPKKSEGSNSLGLNAAFAREKDLVYLPAHNLLSVLFYYFFFKAGWAPS